MPSQTIQWFPGHMAKTRRMITESLSQVDIVIELLDARIPKSSKNPEIDKLTANKPRLVLLTKAALADPVATRRWVEHYSAKSSHKCLAIDTISGEGIKQISPTIREILKEKLERYAAKGMIGKQIRAMVVGIPNVGKSSLINKLCGAKRAKVEDRPGVTVNRQWVTTNIGIELLDMPGVLWPKFEDQSAAIRLAFTGAISDDILDIETLAMKLLSYLAENYPQSLVERYKLEFDENDDGLALLEKVGKKRGMVVSGGEINIERAAITVLDEFRSGKLGRITLEMPEVK